MAAFAGLLLASAATAEPVEYTIILVGNEAGSMTVEQTAERSWTMSYSFNDRGRGPEITATYQVDDHGRPIAVSIEGVDYMKAPVSESLTVNDGVFSWTSSADAGESDQPGFYSSLDGPPGEVILLIQALVASGDEPLPILPAGSARLLRVGTESIEDGTRTLHHVEVHGLGFEPFPLWLNDDDSLYGIVSGWFSAVEQGQDAAVIERLRAIQKDRRQARFRELAEAATTRSEQPILIDNARVFDVESGMLSPANAVVVESGTIQALLTPEDPRPSDTHRVDAKGRTLLPGLWDMHTHLDLADGPLQLAAGVTTVRDLANDHDQLMSIVEAIDNGDAVGPHIFRSGFIDGTGPFAGPTKARIKNAEEANKWIDFYAEHGYHQIKIYSSIPVDLVEGMAQRAHEHGMRFSGHIPAGMWAEDAVRAGYDEIQHINMVFLNFYKDIVETRNPDRFIKVAERGADLDPASEPFQRFVKLLVETETVVDPTVAIFMSLFVHEPGTLSPTLQTAVGRLPPEVVRGNLKGGLAVPEGWEKRYQGASERLLDVIKALHDGGVHLVAGTDAMAGFALQAELIYYQQAGISAADILKLATVGSARVMEVADEVGQIAVGQRADLILVDGKPDEDIADITRVNWVMKAGEIYDPAVLYEALSIRPAPTGGGE